MCEPGCDLLCDFDPIDSRVSSQTGQLQKRYGAASAHPGRGDWPAAKKEARCTQVPLEPAIHRAGATNSSLLLLCHGVGELLPAGLTCQPGVPASQNLG